MTVDEALEKLNRHFLGVFDAQEVNTNPLDESTEAVLRPILEELVKSQPIGRIASAPITYTSSCVDGVHSYDLGPWNPTHACVRCGSPRPSPL